ncbi:MAG: penicillin-binding protein 2 [Thermoanaerobaculia bacterium]
MRAYRDDQKFLNFRINVVTWLIVLTFVFLAGAFWYVQGVQAEKYRALSASNTLREVPIRAKRGLIMDRNGKILADNQPSYVLTLRRSDLREIVKTDPHHRQRMLDYVAGVLGMTVPDLEARMDRNAKQVLANQPLPMAEDLTSEQVAQIEARNMIFPALSVETVQRRNYPYGIMAAHVLGYMGEATNKDLAGDGTLKMGDLIGKKGVEIVYDRYLRGMDGARYMIVDSHGRTISEYTAARRNPTPGRNVFLTIDSDLQRRAEQYFIQKQLVGAAVVLNPKNGEVLAMVSSPAFDPNVFSRRFTPETWKEIVSNPFNLLQNRAIQGLYSPGSVFKAVMAMSGLEHGAITPQTDFFCGGSQVFFGRRFRCWKREGHGDLTLADAIKHSCDVYFYNVGARLGVDNIAETAKELSFGSLTKIDLEGEKAGIVPSVEWAEKKQHRKWYPSETISVAIGQGPLLVTVLQTANMMAAIGNGGNVYRPHVLKAIDDRGPNGKPVRKVVAPEILHQVKLDPSALKAVRLGLWKVVNEPGGTGGNAEIDGLDVCGKTGTVQVVAQHGWIRTESLPFKYRDHAWFASFAPRDNPQLVVVVFVEHGGHGGSDAAPLAKELYMAHFRNQLKSATFDLKNPETLQQLKKGELPKPEAPKPDESF